MRQSILIMLCLGFTSFASLETVRLITEMMAIEVIQCLLLDSTKNHARLILGFANLHKASVNIFIIII